MNHTLMLAHMYECYAVYLTVGIEIVLPESHINKLKLINAFIEYRIVKDQALTI